MKPPTVPVYVQIGERPRVQIGALRGTVAEFGPRYWQAQALREAAEEWQATGTRGRSEDRLGVAAWLRERADRIEATP